MLYREERGEIESKCCVTFSAQRCETMFSAAYQSGNCGVEVVAPGGKILSSKLLKVNGSVPCVYDRSIKGYIFDLRSKLLSHTSLQFPAGKTPLGTVDMKA